LREKNLKDCLTPVARFVRAARHACRAYVFFIARTDRFICAPLYFLRRGCYAVAHVSARGKRTDKINGSIRSFVKPQYVARAGSDIAATNELFAKTCRGIPPKYKSQIGISARDLQKHVAVHRSRIAPPHLKFIGTIERGGSSSLCAAWAARVFMLALHAP